MCASVALKLENGWIVLANFILEIFVGVQGSFNGKKHGKFSRKINTKNDNLILSYKLFFPVTLMFALYIYLIY